MDTTTHGILVKCDTCGRPEIVRLTEPAETSTSEEPQVSPIYQDVPVPTLTPAE